MATNTHLCVWRARILPPFISCRFTLPASWFRRSWINLYPLATGKQAAMLTRHGGGIMWSHGDLGKKKNGTSLITVAYTATCFDWITNVKSRLFQPPVCNRSIFAIFIFFSIRRHFTTTQYSWHWLEFFQKVWAFLFGALRCLTAEETEAKGDTLVSRIKLSCQGFAASCSSRQRQRVRDWLSNSIFKEFAVSNVIWTKFFFFFFFF